MCTFMVYTANENGKVYARVNTLGTLIFPKDILTTDDIIGIIIYNLYNNI